MRLIDSFFQEKVNIPLYHYTGISALMGMANSRSLWANSISYMNDSKEIIHACEAVNRAISPRVIFKEQDNPLSEETKFLKQLNVWINSIKNSAHTIFVFSLSEQASLLSQWRSYTPHGKGVSLEFSPETVNLIARTSHLRVARCLYENEEHSEIIGSLIDKLLQTFRQALPNLDTSNWHPDQCYWGFIQTQTNDIFQVLAIIKHYAFREEREWRLISSHYPNYTDPAIKFREGASMLVPYIHLPLGDGKPYFSKVILGPSPHQNLSMSGLQMFLSNRGLCREVENCSIPYREW